MEHTPLASSEPPPREALFVSSLARAVQVLEAFTDAEEGLGLTELAERCGLTKSAVQRFVHTWCELGYLQKTSGRRLVLTHKVLERSYDFLAQNQLVARATPHLVDARDRCGQNVNMSIRDDLDIVYLVRLPSHRQQLATLLAGRRLPALCTSGGRAMLALLPDEQLEDVLSRSRLPSLTPHTQTGADQLRAEIQEVRQRGFSLTEQQVVMGEIAVAVAVTDTRGNPVAAVHIAAFMDEFPRAKAIDVLAQQAMTTARAIART